MGQNTRLMCSKLVTKQAKLQKGETHNNNAQVTCVYKIQDSGFNPSIFRPSYSIRCCRKRQGNRTLFRVKRMGLEVQRLTPKLLGNSVLQPLKRYPHKRIGNHQELLCQHSNFVQEKCSHLAGVRTLYCCYRRTDKPTNYITVQNNADLSS
jgi:hypothetical protein